jgi:hypothetical protein
MQICSSEDINLSPSAFRCRFAFLSKKAFLFLGAKKTNNVLNLRTGTDDLGSNTARSQNYDFWNYNYNTSVVCSILERFIKAKENTFVLKMH